MLIFEHKKRSFSIYFFKDSIHFDPAVRGHVDIRKNNAGFRCRLA